MSRQFAIDNIHSVYYDSELLRLAESAEVLGSSVGGPRSMPTYCYRLRSETEALVVQDASRLLLVEDEALLGLALADELEAAGYSVGLCSSGFDALIKLTTETGFAALVTDIQLGEGPTGWEVAQFARTKLPEIPVIYTTADSAMDHNSLGVGGSVLLEKPFNPLRLIDTISDLLCQIGSKDEPASQPATYSSGTGTSWLLFHEPVPPANFLEARTHWFTLRPLVSGVPTAMQWAFRCSGRLW